MLDSVSRVKVNLQKHPHIRKKSHVKLTKDKLNLIELVFLIRITTISFLVYIFSIYLINIIININLFQRYFKSKNITKGKEDNFIIIKVRIIRRT
jgi:hypothetical protein